jgi:hypothetical protein
MKASEINIVLVHLGDNLPDYIIPNLNSLVKYGFKTHFISNKKNLISISDEVIKFPIELIKLASDFFVNKTGSKKHDEFLTKTSLRFFIISEYIKIHNLNNFFHIENDVFILDEKLLQKSSNILDDSGYQMCLVMDCKHRCVPSILWFKNYQICNDLWTFISQDNKKTDMELLADYFNSNRDKVTNFPICPKDFILDGDIDFSNMQESMNCIFDGAAIGQYLFGIDDGFGGNLSKGFVNETSVFNPSKFTYVQHGSKLLLNNINIPIANIHMHCKKPYLIET